MSSLSAEKYIGFYMSSAFWAIERVDVDNVSRDKFTDKMSEIVFVTQKHDYTLKICRDSMFLLRIHKLAEKIENNREEIAKDFSVFLAAYSSYLNYINTISLLFESIFFEETRWGYFETQGLTNKDVFSVFYQKDKWAGNSTATSSSIEKFQNARFLALIPNNIPISANALFSSRIIISKSIFEQLSTLFENVYNNKWLISLLSELTKSIGEFKIGSFDTSLIISWFIIESILHYKWSNWIDSKNERYKKNKRINSDRKENIKGKYYSISVIANILKLNDLISFEVFKKLESIRNWRNKIVHRNSKYKCNMEDARITIRTANELIKDNFLINITLNLGFSISL